MRRAAWDELGCFALILAATAALIIAVVWWTGQQRAPNPNEGLLTGDQVVYFQREADWGGTRVLHRGDCYIVQNWNGTDAWELTRSHPGLLGGTAGIAAVECRDTRFPPSP